MCKLIIEQEYNRVELVFDDTVQASTYIESLIPYTTKKTKFTIECEVEEVKGE